MLVLSVIFVGLLLGPEIVEMESTAVDLAIGMIWAAFGLEIVILFFQAPSKRRMLREHWSMCSSSTAPFLRPLRIARLVRVLRAGSALARPLQGVAAIAQRRYLQLRGGHDRGRHRRCPRRPWIGAGCTHSNITDLGDALWWAVTTTTTTVGCGDHFPVAGDGRAVATLLMLVGIGLVGVVTANVAAHLDEDEQANEIADLRPQLDRIEALLANRAS